MKGGKPDGLTGLTIEQLGEGYQRGDFSPTDVVCAYLARIEQTDGVIGAFLSVLGEHALGEASALERGGYDGRPLWGVPVAVKDNICTRGLPTTAASRILEGYRPPYDATVVERLRDAGAIIVGKTNLDEFAMGSSTENSAFGPTGNPWNPACAPGGSSGGSAAAVAGEMAAIALGSDTGGSIRQPASFCGVVGLKGTYGRVSRYGLIAFASSLDQIGPFARSVRDCAIAMQAIGGHDPRDATTIPGGAPDLLSSIEEGFAGLRVGCPAALGDWEMDACVRDAARRAFDGMEADGATVEEVVLPDPEVSIACYYVLANAEASSNLARYDGVKYGLRVEGRDLAGMYENTRGEGFGDEVKRRVLLGTYVLSAGYYDAYYAKAQRVKAMMCERYERLFEDLDLIALPTSPTPAFRLGERVDDPIAMYLSDIFTTAANIAGLPAISVPAALSPDGLPLGMQLVAAAGREDLLMRGARAMERIFRFRETHPRPGGDAS
ncbi:MAG: Asp-tRNA(Asn)/Glu-tRNA(Gln) amidotransferase subunit GatA [Candidatus Krumholzibacteriota bacterium]|nr:Asp-tRNA(Asn)/Glu-tRNA(Gln) amidotransferase subunit GatA [Candidatus Krumholzibacteriota bacterium]